MWEFVPGDTVRRDRRCEMRPTTWGRKFRLNPAYLAIMSVGALTALTKLSMVRRLHRRQVL